MIEDARFAATLSDEGPVMATGAYDAPCQDPDCDACDHEDEEPPYGSDGSMLNPSVTLKWIADGITEGSEVAGSLRSHADYVDGLVARGWKVSQPVDGGWVMFHWAGEGPPPDEDKQEFS